MTTAGAAGQGWHESRIARAGMAAAYEEGDVSSGKVR
jgi:hypothetical protein